MYLWLCSSDLAIKRVAHRVAKGGHHVPEATIRRRYESGLKNVVKHYLPIAHTALILDNSNEKQKVIASKSITNDLEIEDVVIWKEILRLANE